MSVASRIADLTPEQLQQLQIRMQAMRPKAGATEGIPRRTDAGSAPLSFAQQRLWFLHQLEPQSAAYNLPFPLRLRGRLDVPALERSFSALVRRHEILRTVFPGRNGEPVQEVLPSAPRTIPVADLRSLPASVRDNAVRHLVGGEAVHPFDLARGPLFRTLLLRLDEEEWGLVVTLHHIVGDGWSIRVLMREISLLYEAFVRGGESPLPELPLQYGDYAAWQRGYLSGETLERQLTWWKEHLRGAPSLLELPADFPRTPARRPRGAEESLRIPPGVLAGVHGLAREEGATPYMVLLAAFQLLLGRLAGTEDVVVGTPIASRTRKEVEGLIGLFVNTLALRTDLSGSPSFRALLARVRDVMLGAYARQEVPFEKLVEELGVERSLTHTPLFQVMLNFLNLKPERRELPGLVMEESLADRVETHSMFDFTLYATEEDGALHLRLRYAADLFAPGRMREMLEQFGILLERVVEGADEPVGGHSLLTPAARAVLPDPVLPLEAAWHGGVHELFSAQARSAPERVAVRDPRESWSYGELEARSNQLAHFLLARGLARGEVVAVHAHRSASLVWALLGVLKAGGAFLVLDPAYPTPRLLAMLRAGRPRALLRIEAAGPLPEALEKWLAESGASSFALPALSAAMEAGLLGESPTCEPEVRVGPEDVAYLAFTSGTTGGPKGIVGTHRPLSHFVRWQKDTFGITAEDRFSVLSGLAHDPLLRDVFTPLSSGAALCIPDPEEIGTPGYLAGWMVREGVTVAHLTPAMGRLLESAGGVELPVLRWAFWGGEKVGAADVERLPTARSVVFYGATETPQAVACYPVPEDAAAGGVREALPVGRGIEGVQLLVLTRAGALAGVGEVGEICVRTPYLARGYLADEAGTRERFVANPFRTDPGDRIYRTGDLGRYRPDGVVQILGRADQQVKVRGFRVEPEEVEAALRSYPGVREAAVVARDDAPGGWRLVGYVAAGEEASPEALRTHLQRSLPEHMVPSAFVVLGHLPLTPNGKLDRGALPAPDLSAQGPEHVAPRTPTEEVLAGIWAEVLGVERVGIHNSFFELGGHSLLATRVISRVRDAFGVEPMVRAIFEAPTVAELAERVEEIRRTGLPVLPAIERVERTGEPPLSFAQERLWFLDRLQPESAFYNISAAVRLVGVLDERALERAMGEVVRRHEPLRTTFRERDGAAVQVIASFGGFALPVEDVSGPGEAEARRQAAEEAARPFDLSAGTLFRAKLLRLGEEEHVLLLCMHHIVSDGWSTGILIRELTALYGAYRKGRESPLPELRVQYADYAAWQREQLRGEELGRQLSYWRERLVGAPALLELPTDRPRPSVQTHRGAREPVELPRELLERLKALGQREGATLYMVLLGAFQVLLSKYSGSEDVVVGSPIAGRTRSEVEGLIGFFANTLVLRTDLGGDPNFREVLRRVREVTLGAYEHQELPFEKLVAELQPQRSLSHSPLFQVMFVLQDPERPGAGLEGLRVEGMESELATTKFDLALAVAEHPDGIVGVLEYSTDLFERSTIERMLAHFGRVLEQVVGDADRPVSELALLDGAERHRVVEEWNRTAAEYPTDRCIHELFEAQVERTPDAVAVVHEEECLTYRELNARASQLAHHLRRLGVGPEVRVGVCMERSLEMGVGLLAILKAGGAYVPLDPAYPPERLRHMLDDSAPLAVLTHGAVDGVLEGAFGGADVVVVDLDRDAAAWADWPEANPERAGLTPESLAYVIYTSGSTGRPKGVMNQHRCVVNRLLWGQEAWGLGAHEAMLCKTSLSFDGSLRELFWPWSVGARVVMARPEGQRDPDYLLETIRRERIGTVNLVPSMLQLLLEHPEVERCTKLRQVLCGGEALPSALLERFHERLPHAALHNLYGPSEAATALAALGCTPEQARATTPVGRPTANVRVYLLNVALGPVPVGVAGELYVGGAGVARGYLERPELTAERFVPDPFGGDPGGRLYRTGDLGRWLADGTVEFLGRNDFQVKVRGFRIEPGEIEACLCAHPDVREAVVLAREDAYGDRRLVAYCVGADAVQAEGMRAYLSERLPEYMVPSAFVRLDALPLTPNGKLDRRALPAPEGDAYARRAYEAPVGEVEGALAGIWTELLGVERVGRWDHFFELGGHSLRAVQVISRVRQVLGVEVALAELFLRPVLADFARSLEGARRADLAAIKPVARDEPLPLSFAQERLWFLDRLQPGGVFYTIPVPLRLEGALDRPVLERALGEIVRRHEALRTTFQETHGSPVQVIAPFGGFSLPVEDLSGLSEAEVRRSAAEETAQPFDLSAGPLFRAKLLRLGEEEHVLLLCMHHIISDGWSVDVLFRELSVLYAAYRDGRESPLPELAVQYADHAVWQREQFQGETLERQLSWWKERLSGAPELLELPTDRPRPAVMSFRGAYEQIRFSGELLERLEALGQREGATLYMVLLGAFQVLLSKYSESEDVVVGSTIAGRTRSEVEALIGLFMNTLVLRTDLSGNPPFREVLRRVREVTLGAYEHQEVPFERLVEELRPERSLGHSPLIQVLLELDNTEGPGTGLPGLDVRGVDTELGTAKFDLSVSLWVTPQGLIGRLTYSTDLFEPGTARRMVEHLERVLEQVAEDADVRLSDLELIGAEERARVVEEWNRTEAEYPAEQCIHQLFEAQAACTPDAVAVTFGDESLTYRELDERANRLAHHLVRMGVGPEVRVGLCLERSLELMVSILGVMKAGGAYVPVDPAHPAERTGYVLEDSGVAILLTQERLRERLPVQAGVEVLSVDAEWERIAAESAAVPESGVSSENLAYVIYTSGSTGRPKGVAMHHRGVSNYIHWGVRAYGADQGSGAPVFSSMAVDLTITNLLPLFVGHPVHLLPEESPVEALAEVLRERPGFGLMKITPTHLSLLTPLITAEDARAAAKTLVVGADFLSAETTLFFQEHAPNVRLMNEYGPTETVVGCSAYVLPNGVHRAGPVPVGGPIQNMRFYVLDAHLEPVPVGLPGELYIGGVGVARGYLGRPGLSAEKFVPDPFAGEGARMYRTGDRARWQADGNLLILGRTDNQVKIRGYRVELGEIEAALRRHEAVRECLVVLREDVPGDKRLVAYVVADAEEIDPAELREHLRRSVPEYMVPSAFVRLNALPHTSTGKFDPRMLPAPEYAGAEERYVAPRNDLERSVAEVWRSVLGLPEVGVHDNFFDLGGTSLLLYRVYSRLREVRSDLRVVDLFRYTTVEALAAYLEAAEPRDTDFLAQSRSRAEERRTARRSVRRR